MKPHEVQIYIVIVIAILISYALKSITRTDAMLLIIACTTINILVLISRINEKIK